MSTIEVDPGQSFPSVLNIKRGAELRRYVPERTCYIVRYIDQNPASMGGLVHRCSSCRKALPKALFRNGWTKLDYCPRCGARVVEGKA